MGKGEKGKSERLEMPEFSATIPDYLLDGASPHEKYILTALSRAEQQNAWIAARLSEQGETLAELGERLAGLEARLTPIEKWRTILESRWTMAAGVGLAVPAVAEVFGFFKQLLK